VHDEPMMQACAEAQQQPVRHSSLVAHGVPLGASVTTSTTDASTTPASEARDPSLDVSASLAVAASLDVEASFGGPASPTNGLEPKDEQAPQRTQLSTAFRPRTVGE
jgi:hypothetical protein